MVSKFARQPPDATADAKCARTRQLATTPPLPIGCKKSTGHEKTMHVDMISERHSTCCNRKLSASSVPATATVRHAETSSESPTPESAAPATQQQHQARPRRCLAKAAAAADQEQRRAHGSGDAAGAPLILCDDNSADMVCNDVALFQSTYSRGLSHPVACC